MATLTMGQVATSLLPALKDDRLFAAIYLAFGTGLRRGELLGLRWQDIDFQKEVLHVRQALVRVKNHDAHGDSRKTRLTFQEPKIARSRRTVPIPMKCLTALKRYKAQQAAEKLLLGHSRIAVTLDTYSRVSMELEKKEAAKLIATLTGRN